MKQNTIRLPAVRADLTVHSSDNEKFPFTVVDEVMKQHIPLNALGYWIFNQLSCSQDSTLIINNSHNSDNSEVSNLNPRTLYRHISFMAERGLFQGIRADNNTNANDSMLLTNDSQSQLVFEYEDGLKHECQACGSCCSATDVGPVDPATVQMIEEEDWSNDIDLNATDGLFRTFHSGDTTLHLTQMKQDQCVFLSAEKKCLIHARLGKHKKPTPCKQFPYIFSRIQNRIQVSIQMECRAYLKAKNAADHTRTQESELNHLIESGSPIHIIDRPIRIDDGLLISLEEYLAIERTIVSAVRSSDFGLGALDPLIGFAIATESELTRLYGPILEDEKFREKSIWESVHGGSFDSVHETDPWAYFLHQLNEFETSIAGFAKEASVVAEERSLIWLAQRFSVLERTIRAACSNIEPQSFMMTNLSGIKTIIADVLVSGLLARDAVRQGELRTGLAMLGLKAWLTLCGGCQRAKDACRVEVSEQDIIDSMVTISKMLREKAVRDVLGQQKNTIISVFLTNLEVFTQRRAPYLEGPGGIQ